MKKLLANIYLNYIKFFAKLKLKKINPTIIGVGGASGKSSLSNLITLVLNERYNVHSSGGKNSESGIPLDILGIKLENYSYTSWFKSFLVAPFKLFSNNNNFDFYIAELGIDSPKPPKNMSYLLSILTPDISVLTNISIEHSLNFDYLINDENDKKRKDKILDEITKEEGLLFTSLDSASKAIVNLDDLNIKKLLPISAKTVTVSEKDNDSDFIIKKITVSKNSFELDFDFLKEDYLLHLNQPLPKYFAKTIMLAVAVCFSSGISIKDIIQIIESGFSLPPGRFSIIDGIKNSTIIDSSYNSSLESVVGAIETMVDIQKDGRRVAILGDMRELGSLSKIQHEELAKSISKNLDYVILIGPDMKEFVSPILDKSKFKYLSFISFSDAKSNILKNIKERDLILVKGSQNDLFLERAVELLLKNKKDKEKLPRRGNYWDNIRLSIN